MNNTEETGGLMPRSVAEMVSKYNYMMVELRDPRYQVTRGATVSRSS